MNTCNLLRVKIIIHWTRVNIKKMSVEYTWNDVYQVKEAGLQGEQFELVHCPPDIKHTLVWVVSILFVAITRMRILSKNLKSENTLQLIFLISTELFI